MIKKAMEVRLKVKPVMGILVHSDFWDGPCRGGIREEMTPQAEMARAKKLFEQYQPLFQQLDPWVEVLEPVFVPYDESFVVEEKILQEIERDLPQTDCLMILHQRIPKIERLNKPLISYTHAVSAADKNMGTGFLGVVHNILLCLFFGRFGQRHPVGDALFVVVCGLDFVQIAVRVKPTRTIEAKRTDNARTRYRQNIFRFPALGVRKPFAALNPFHKLHSFYAFSVVPSGAPGFADKFPHGRLPVFDGLRHVGGSIIQPGGLECSLLALCLADRPLKRPLLLAFLVLFVVGLFALPLLVLRDGHPGDLRQRVMTAVYRFLHFCKDWTISSPLWGLMFQPVRLRLTRLHSSPLVSTFHRLFCGCNLYRNLI